MAGKKNHTPWNKGIKYTEKQKTNLIIANRSKPTYGHLGKHHSNETKQKISEIQKDWVWWTNGVEEKHCKDTPGEDWYRGRVYKHNAGVYHWWNNGKVQKFCKECPGDDFQRGCLKQNQKENKSC